MKTKVIIAYEPVSSGTMRLTPSDVGKLLYTARADELAEVLGSYWEQAELFATTESKQERLKVIKEFLNACSD